MFYRSRAYSVQARTKFMLHIRVVTPGPKMVPNSEKTVQGKELNFKGVIFLPY